MDCCQNQSPANEATEKKKVSWKMILVAVIILGLLVIGLLA